MIGLIGKKNNIFSLKFPFEQGRPLKCCQISATHSITAGYIVLWLFIIIVVELLLNFEYFVID